MNRQQLSQWVHKVIGAQVAQLIKDEYVEEVEDNDEKEIRATSSDNVGKDSAAMKLITYKERYCIGFTSEVAA